MIVFLKHAAITVAIIIAFVAAIIAPVAMFSASMSTKPGEDSSGLLSFSALCVIVVCVLLIILLSGCAEVRTLYHACKDGMCR